MIQKHTKIARGFTLVELMIVVAIIGLLSSIVLASLAAAKAKGNTAKRLESAKQIENALEIYYINNGQTYPTTGGSWQSTCNTWGPVAQWIPAGITPYLSTLPTDPDVDTANSKCCYLYRSNGTDYKLAFGYGLGAGPAATCAPLAGQYGAYPRYIDPQRDTTPNDGKQNWNGATVLYDWAIYTPGAAQW